ncbi:MAG: ribonuclease HII [Acidobacteria bacterium]|nr:ribonuclease HII [Acidobacteriota bacterium]
MTISAARKALEPAQHRCTGSLEREARSLGYLAIAGVDEVGRGCLFGPVFAAAVILSPDRPVTGLRDSKVLDSARREELAAAIRERAVAVAVAAADVYEVDRINIYQASRLAMKRAVSRLGVPADYLLVDALGIDLPLPQQALIHGDARCQSIAAASILAKVERDACMARWDRIFPEYGLARNKGYSTPGHVAALREAHGAAAMAAAE